MRFALALLLWTITSTAAAAAAGDPFRDLDVVSLFARTPGTVPLRSIAGQPPAYQSQRYDMFGRPDARAAISGRLHDGTWVLVSPFMSGTMGATDAMIYRWTPAGIRAVAALHAPTDHMTVAIAHGLIEQSFSIYAADGRCERASREIRTFDLRAGTLRRVGRRQLNPSLDVTLDSRLPAAIARPSVEDLASRTPHLYLVCFLTQHYERRYYEGDGIELYGMPMSSREVDFMASGDRLRAVPFASGGSGGAFTGAVYRIEGGRVVTVRTLPPGEHLLLRVRDGRLESAHPHRQAREADCCFARVDVTTYRYDALNRRLAAVATASEATDDFLRGR